MRSSRAARRCGCRRRTPRCAGRGTLVCVGIPPERCHRRASRSGARCATREVVTGSLHGFLPTADGMPMPARPLHVRPLPLDRLVERPIVRRRSSAPFADMRERRWRAHGDRPIGPHPVEYRSPDARAVDPVDGLLREAWPERCRTKDARASSSRGRVAELRPRRARSRPWGRSCPGDGCSARERGAPGHDRPEQGHGRLRPPRADHLGRGELGIAAGAMDCVADGVIAADDVGELVILVAVLGRPGGRRRAGGTRREPRRGAPGGGGCALGRPVGPGPGPARSPGRCDDAFYSGR